MLTRRHIRIKVMQSLYAFFKSHKDDLKPEETLLQKSSADFYNLYLVLFQLFVALQHCANDLLEKGKRSYLGNSSLLKNQKFADNRAILQLANDPYLQEAIGKRKLHHWKNHTEYVRLIWDTIEASPQYLAYVENKEDDFKQDKLFLIQIFEEVIAPHDKLYELLEEINITWVDDIPLVNTILLKSLQRLTDKNNKSVVMTQLYKDSEDATFGLQLFRKVALNSKELSKHIEGRTPNWETERIADLDALLLKMAIAEFLYFPSIPTRVSINEYLEISKEYSSEKSSFFINGILDKLSKEFENNGTMNKSPRGLL